MSPFMNLESPRNRESLATLGAGIRFFPGVTSHVNHQFLLPREGLYTHGTGIRLDVTVSPLVTLQSTIIGESNVTLGAGIRFLSCVDSHVSPQIM